MCVCAGWKSDRDRSILEALKKKRLVADWMCTVNFVEGSRRPRDSRPLFRLCSLVVADQKKSDFKNSHLVKDGCVNNCTLLAVEASCLAPTLARALCDYGLTDSNTCHMVSTDVSTAAGDAAPP